mmetsp:Transcript_46898/g.133806  ORF Transcript_46898/g.133806 Transcript_46898/m.133806 type:complete len:557 (+) Transcript_46898:1732-3402(+)
MAIVKPCLQGPVHGPLDNGAKGKLQVGSHLAQQAHIGEDVLTETQDAGPAAIALRAELLQCHGQKERRLKVGILIGIDHLQDLASRKGQRAVLVVALPVPENGVAGELDPELRHPCATRRTPRVAWNRCCHPERAGGVHEARVVALASWGLLLLDVCDAEGAAERLHHGLDCRNPLDVIGTTVWVSKLGVLLHGHNHLQLVVDGLVPQRLRGLRLLQLQQRRQRMLVGTANALNSPPQGLHAEGSPPAELKLQLHGLQLWAFAAGRATWALGPAHALQEASQLAAVVVREEVKHLRGRLAAEEVAVAEENGFREVWHQDSQRGHLPYGAPRQGLHLHRARKRHDAPRSLLVGGERIGTENVLRIKQPRDVWRPMPCSLDRLKPELSQLIVAKQVPLAQLVQHRVPGVHEGCQLAARKLGPPVARLRVCGSFLLSLPHLQDAVAGALRQSAEPPAAAIAAGPQATQPDHAAASADEGDRSLSKEWHGREATDGRRQEDHGHGRTKEPDGALGHFLQVPPVDAVQRGAAVDNDPAVKVELAAQDRQPEGRRGPRAATG